MVEGEDNGRSYNTVVGRWIPSEAREISIESFHASVGLVSHSLSHSFMHCWRGGSGGREWLVAAAKYHMSFVSLFFCVGLKRKVFGICGSSSMLKFGNDDGERMLSVQEDIPRSFLDVYRLARWYICTRVVV